MKRYAIVACSALTIAGSTALAAPDGGFYEAAINALNPVVYMEYDEALDTFSATYPGPVDSTGNAGSWFAFGSSSDNYNDATDLAPALATESNTSIFIRYLTDQSGAAPDGGTVDVAGPGGSFLPTGQKYWGSAFLEDAPTSIPVSPNVGGSFSAVTFMQFAQTRTQGAQNAVILGNSVDAPGPNGTNGYTQIQLPGAGAPIPTWSFYLKDTDEEHHAYNDPDLDPALSTGGSGNPVGLNCGPAEDLPNDLRCDSGSDLTFGFTDGQNNNVQWNTGLDLQDGNPHLVGFSYNAGTKEATIFVDGAEAATTKTVVGSIDDILPAFDPGVDFTRLTLGNHYGGHNIFHGLLDETAVFVGDNTLSGADHAALWETSQGPVPEPASLALLAVGGLLTLIRRR